MKFKFQLLSTVFLFGILITGCKTHWLTAVKEGAVPTIPFEQTISFEINTNLIFIPVEINGETYRFLFDSGAPCSISKELHENHTFKNLKSGHVRDTDNNRAPTEWVLLDSMKIGDVLFENQPAFVGDFTANPVLACLNADGIIGSNNIKFCNWKIDTRKKEMTLTNLPIDSLADNGLSANFQYDRQFNMNLEFDIGNVKLKHIHLDYGSNGTLSISNAQFDTLAAHNLLDSVFIQSGVKQSGIVGKITAATIRISKVDTIKIGDLVVPDVKLHTGTAQILGNKITSNYLVTIDSENQKLYLKPHNEMMDYAGTFGFQPGYSPSKNIYIQSIISGSAGDQAGLKANMQILSIDTLDFENKHNICDYMKYNDLTNYNAKSISMKVKDVDGEVLELHIERSSLFD